MSQFIETEDGTFEITEEIMRTIKKRTTCNACLMDINKGDIARVRTIKGFGKYITHAESDVCKLNHMASLVVLE